MVRKQKLKVYRTPIGFHDAYVAAPSQKDALTAWGSDADLFSRGLAELVTDEGLTHDALANPGTVFRRSRGTNDEYLAALARDEPSTRKREPSHDGDAGPLPRRRRPEATDRAPRHRDQAPPPAGTHSPAKMAKPRARPRPSRDKLDEAEKALKEAQAEHKKRVAEFRRRERELQTERRAIEADHEREISRLETALAKVRDHYGEALRKWRGD